MNRRSGLRLGLALLLAAPGVLAGAAQGKGRVSEARRVQALERRVEALQEQLLLRPMDISAYELPDEVTFCGVPVDLDRDDIRERMEREFYLILGNRAQVVLWMKRAGRVFPTIEKRLGAAGTCGDLKYLAVIESGLRPAVTSRAAARGWWQFMAGTGKQYGLSTGRSFDQRADLDRSTAAGVAYLKDLRKRFGSWPLAMAAYNTGPGRLGRAMRAQGLRDFWRLDLFTEAERYVPRIIAAKLILSQPARYGFQMGIRDGWKAEPVGYVKLAVPNSEISLLAVARGSGVDYRTLRRLNPELGTDRLPAGRTIALRVPPGREKATRGWFEGAAKQAVKKKTRRAAKKKARRAAKRKARARRPRRYKVRAGESLWSIATRHDVTVKELRRWNKLRGKSVLQPGQRLVVSR